VESSCECCNEPSGSIRCWEVLEWLQTGSPLSRKILFILMGAVAFLTPRFTFSKVPNILQRYKIGKSVTVEVVGRVM
jgi:hypothetical protein